ncbi:hypothetical protein DAD186_19000 [Dermabacter vaginalis]|uniref:Uncharacterized protein n=1 Tax=Dermabacter vaginalis TaxID=1630135 RepID=A0A1B0ZKI3_9MICO|nr:hypothetical protein DAD186_19000 [Dermabacter vaginalis]
MRYEALGSNFPTLAIGAYTNSRHRVHIEEATPEVTGSDHGGESRA